MKFLLLSVIFLFSANIVCQEAPFSDFLVGKYIVVGKAIGSNTTYTGNVEIYLENGRLIVKRTINGQETIGTAELEPVLNGDKKVLKFRYMKANKEYEQTCLWQSDLDNYARISCYLYNPKVHTKDPGLEVLFHDHTTD